jgi:hypothetical protein
LHLKIGSKLESKQSERMRPWYRATLVLRCPACGAPPGYECRRRRAGFHRERYALARELAGEPLRGSGHEVAARAQNQSGGASPDTQPKPGA